MFRNVLNLQTLVLVKRIVTHLKIIFGTPLTRVKKIITIFGRIYGSKPNIIMCKIMIAIADENFSSRSAVNKYNSLYEKCKINEASFNMV